MGQETPDERHNRLIHPLLKMLCKDGEGIADEGETMVLLETLTLAVVRVYRPDNIRAQVLMLEAMSEAVIRRMEP